MAVGTGTEQPHIPAGGGVGAATWPHSMAYTRTRMYAEASTGEQTNNKHTQVRCSTRFNARSPAAAHKALSKLYNYRAKGNQPAARAWTRTHTHKTSPTANLCLTAAAQSCCVG